MDEMVIIGHTKSTFVDIKFIGKGCDIFARRVSLPERIIILVARK